MTAELTERLFDGYLTEIDAEFRDGFPLWSRIPESTTGKALGIIRLHSDSGDRTRQLLKERCRNLREVRVRALRTKTMPSGFNPGEWSTLLAGDGSVWGKISLTTYISYEHLRAFAKTALSKSSERQHEIVLKDELPIGRATAFRLANMKPAPWRVIISGIEDALKRGGWRKVGPWAKAAFEKQIDDGRSLRVDFDSIRGGFGFDYRLSLMQNGDNVDAFSYEQNIGIGIGTWDRVDEKSLPEATQTLRDVIARMEALLGV